MSQVKKPADQLREEIVRLAPWHHEIQVTPDVNTRASLEAARADAKESQGEVSFLNMRDNFMRKMSRVYPNGLEGRSVLDCGCNCGECLFWLKELGAGECFGIDVREHWIRQAEFLRENLDGPTEGVRFEVRDLYELPQLGLEQFDVVLFHGLFYHLPDPITGIKIAADLCREMMVINTATRSGQPDGFLAVDEEGLDELLSGVYGLNWFPTGPEVMFRILAWLGFAEARLLWWQEQMPGKDRGRLELHASRKPGLIQGRDTRRL